MTNTINNDTNSAVSPFDDCFILPEDKIDWFRKTYPNPELYSSQLCWHPLSFTPYLIIHTPDNKKFALPMTQKVDSNES